MSVSLKNILDRFTTARGTPTKLSQLVKNGTYVKYYDFNVGSVPYGLPISLSQFKYNGNIADPNTDPNIGNWRFIAGWVNNDFVKAGDVDNTWFYDGTVDFTQWRTDREQEEINALNANANFYEQQWNSWVTGTVLVFFTLRIVQSNGPSWYKV